MAMKRSRKIALVGVAALAVVAAVSIIVQRQRAGVVAVQIGTVTHQDLTAVVTASGEVRPRQYVNINAQSFGKIVEINVQEGDRVKRGEGLRRLEAIQPGADGAFKHAGPRWRTGGRTDEGTTRRRGRGKLRRSRAD